MGNARRHQALLAQQLGNVMRRRLPFHRRVGRQDHLGEGALLLDPRHQLRNPDRLRPQPVQRRQVALEHEVAATVAGLLHCIHIGRPFDHTQLGIVTARVGALRAQLLLGQGAALTAMPNPLHGLGQGLSQAQATATVTLEQLQGHALGGFLADTRENTQGIDQLADERAEAHGKGLTIQ
ncbi:hypothetical protein D3C72_1688500 [compost metagenome]